MDESNEEDDGTQAEFSHISDSKVLVGFSVLSFSGSDDVLNREGGGGWDFSWGHVGSDWGRWFLLESIESAGWEVSWASGAVDLGAGSKITQSHMAWWQNQRILLVSVISWLDQEQSSETSDGTGSEDDERSSVIQVSDIVHKETETEGPGIDEWEDDNVEDEVEESNSLQGDSFGEHSSGDGGGDNSQSASPDEMSELGGLIVDQLIVGISEFLTNVVNFSSNERAVNITEAPSKTEHEHAEDGQNDVNKDLVPDDSGVLSTD